MDTIFFFFKVFPSERKNSLISMFIYLFQCCFFLLFSIKNIIQFNEHTQKKNLTNFSPFLNKCNITTLLSSIVFWFCFQVKDEHDTHTQWMEYDHIIADWMNHHSNWNEMELNFFWWKNYNNNNKKLTEAKRRIDFDFKFRFRDSVFFVEFKM